MNIHRSFVEPMIKGGARINEFVDLQIKNCRGTARGICASPNE